MFNLFIPNLLYLLFHILRLQIQLLNSLLIDDHLFPLLLRLVFLLLDQLLIDFLDLIKGHLQRGGIVHAPRVQLRRSHCVHKVWRLLLQSVAVSWEFVRWWWTRDVQVFLTFYFQSLRGRGLFVLFFPLPTGYLELLFFFEVKFLYLFGNLKLNTLIEFNILFSQLFQIDFTFFKFFLDFLIRKLKKDFKVNSLFSFINKLLLRR